MSLTSARGSTADKALKHCITLKCVISRHRNSATLGEESIMLKNVFHPYPQAPTADSQDFFFSKKTFYTPFLSSSEDTYVISLEGIKGNDHSSWDLSFKTLPQTEREILPRRPKHSHWLAGNTLLIKGIWGEQCNTASLFKNPLTGVNLQVIPKNHYCNKKESLICKCVCIELKVSHL